MNARPGRRLARVIHNAYHHPPIHAPEHTCCALTDRDGRLREIVISRMEMDRAIAAGWVRVVRLPSRHRRVSRQDVEALPRQGLLDPPRRRERTSRREAAR